MIGLQHELEQANEDLEAFAYAASHDLRLPLTVITSLTQILELQDSLDERGRDCVGRIQDAAARMGSMIEDLLAFSRAGRSDMSPSEVDLGALAQDVARGLRLRHPGHPVGFEVQEGLRVVADGHLMRVVLEILLDRAWRRTLDRDGPQVRLALQVHEGRPSWIVEDNGIGFSEMDAEHAFDPFWKAQGDPGTGVALATVRRIVERHGGTVWAQGSAHAGARLGFTLGPVAGVGSRP